MTHVPYRDFGQLYIAVANRELRFIAFAGPVRDKLYPNVPCTAELAKFQGYQVQGWVGLFAPRAAPPAACLTIADKISDALKSPALLERTHLSVTRRLQLFAVLMQRETTTWGGIVKTAGVRLD